jgi:DsrH like protein.
MHYKEMLMLEGFLQKVADNIKIVDYAGFVDLVVEHGTTVSWV